MWHQVLKPEYLGGHQHLGKILHFDNAIQQSMQQTNLVSTHGYQDFHNLTKEVYEVSMKQWLDTHPYPLDLPDKTNEPQVIIQGSIVAGSGACILPEPIAVGP